MLLQPESAEGWQGAELTQDPQEEEMPGKAEQRTVEQRIPIRGSKR